MKEFALVWHTEQNTDPTVVVVAATDADHAESVLRQLWHEARNNDEFDGPEVYVDAIVSGRDLQIERDSHR